jgi:hypothetical protein
MEVLMKKLSRSFHIADTELLTCALPRNKHRTFIFQSEFYVINLDTAMIN